MVVKVKAHTRRVSGKAVKVRAHKRAPRGHSGWSERGEGNDWGIFYASKHPHIKQQQYAGKSYKTEASAKKAAREFEPKWRKSGRLLDNDKLVVRRR